MLNAFTKLVSNSAGLELLTAFKDLGLQRKPNFCEIRQYHLSVLSLAFLKRHYFVRIMVMIFIRFFKIAKKSSSKRFYYSQKLNPCKVFFKKAMLMIIIAYVVKYGLLLHRNFWKLLQIHEHEGLRIHLKTKAQD